MTILGRGDLSPPRRHRHTGRTVTILVVLLLLAAGGFAAYRHLRGGPSTATVAARLPACPRPQPSAASLPPGRLVVDNASLRTGLAARVARRLRHRGFRIGSVGNASRLRRGTAVVRYSPDRAALARQAAAQVSGAKLVAVGGSGVAELDLARHFRALATRSAARAAAQHLAGPSPSPSASPTQGCRRPGSHSHG